MRYSDDDSHMDQSMKSIIGWPESNGFACREESNDCINTTRTVDSSLSGSFYPN